MNRPQTNIALIAGLAAALSLAGCNNQPDEDGEDTPEAVKTVAADDAPKTDAEGNEIVSEGPDEDARPYGSGKADGDDAGSTSASALGGDDAVRPSASSASAPASASARPPVSAPAPRPPRAQGSAPAAPASKPTAGSKLQKADPQ